MVTIISAHQLLQDGVDFGRRVFDDDVVKRVAVGVGSVLLINGGLQQQAGLDRPAAERAGGGRRGRVDVLGDAVAAVDVRARSDHLTTNQFHQ